MNHRPFPNPPLGPSSSSASPELASSPLAALEKRPPRLQSFNPSRTGSDDGADLPGNDMRQILRHISQLRSAAFSRFRGFWLLSRRPKQMSFRSPYGQPLSMAAFFQALQPSTRPSDRRQPFPRVRDQLDRLHLRDTHLSIGRRRTAIFCNRPRALRSRALHLGAHDRRLRRCRLSRHSSGWNSDRRDNRIRRAARAQRGWLPREMFAPALRKTESVLGFSCMTCESSQRRLTDL
jgi:hypothetical protein